MVFVRSGVDALRVICQYDTPHQTFVTFVVVRGIANVVDLLKFFHLISLRSSFWLGPFIGVLFPSGFGHNLFLHYKGFLLRKECIMLFF